MSLILPHRVRIQGHSKVRYLWRATCSCGWSAHAGTEAHARMAGSAHLEEEEPFPLDMISDDPTHGRDDS